MKGICKKCGYVADYNFNVNGERVQPVCKRCGKNMVHQCSIIKRYFQCSQCLHIEKIPEVTAIQLIVSKEKAKCIRTDADGNKCGGHLFPVSKVDYLKASGRARKHLNTQIVTLDEMGAIP